MVSGGAVVSVCPGDADSATGPGQSSLVSIVSVVAGGVGFAVPVLRGHRFWFDPGSSVLRRQDRAFWGSSSSSAPYGPCVSFLTWTGLLEQ
jgi:hypothetical protein